MVTNLDQAYHLRDDLIEAVTVDALGPRTPDEIITDRPATKYISGVLYPGNAGSIDPANDVDTFDGYDELSLPDQGISLANRRYPSSMGITFSVDPSIASEIVLSASAAAYEPYESAASDDDESGEAPRERWRRIPIGPIDVKVNVKNPGDTSTLIADGLELFLRVRGTTPGNPVTVTAALVNRRTTAGLYDSDCFFQAEISVVSSGGAAAFVARDPITDSIIDEELESYRLLYRHSHTFAVGHGCSADWTLANQPDRAVAIRSTYVPEYQLSVAEANRDIDLPSLSMERIVAQPREETLGDFRELAASYEEWIDELKIQASRLSVPLQRTADRHIGECMRSVERLRRGIKVLEVDDLAWEAFRLANLAMVKQRDRASGMIDEDDSTGADPDRHRWYPFQIAFILLTLEGIADPSSKDRAIADLLWFPTGGGKTEAYLGLIAFTILLRRLRSPRLGGGVTALMRYTLRLLTLQQFERAAILICALESLRRSRSDLGNVPISIGLWVGRDATPLTRRETRTALEKLRTGNQLDKGNPVQLHRCPWCAQPLDHSNYWMPKDQSRLVVSCKNSQCEFGTMGRGSLPVFLIDEDVYDYRPSLIIATVDKFASMPWRDRVGEIFNIGSPEPAPELIVQDELHLISGPLGTLTGLYETVVDHFCSLDGSRPKVIASTATIRRAGKQGAGLFARTVSQFPPPGIDARDSFFAVEAPRDRRGNRSYLGLMAPGTSHTTLLVRAYASLLQASAEADVDESLRDVYWTLVGYFNSLRVLGGARMQVRDDVGDRIDLLAKEHGTEPRQIPSIIEMTSRAASAVIPAYLAQMGLQFPDVDAVDVVLATNMISVGVDVGRLGLMVVMGQPPSSSEYIQATSRVGRQNPGLVVVLYDSSRSRDQSHYERFIDYHASIYQQVEATSVTPFAQRARDRGLHAIVVALARHLLPEFGGNAGASAITSHRDLLLPITNIILSRVEAVDAVQRDAVEAELERFIDHWEARAAVEPSLVYSNYRDPAISLLGDAAEFSDNPSEPRGTLWSLRGVDQSSNLYLDYS